MRLRPFFIAAVCASLLACAPIPNNPVTDEPTPGPDKQGSGLLYGALLGAGAGAVAGAQLGAGTGPGALIGAGFGAAYGSLAGLGTDLLEDDQLRRYSEMDRTLQMSWAHEVLAEHYKRRLELHPSRDIFPADVFFADDDTTLRPEAKLLIHEMANLSKRHMPWSRVVVASYLKSSDLESEFAAKVNQKRAEEIALELINAGVGARRVLVQGITMPEPILIDPYDSPNRYAQAIEFIALDY